MEKYIAKLQENFDRVTEISATDIGCTRFSYSEEDLKVRERLMAEMRDMGMEIAVDFVGNIRGKYNPGALETKSILIGSHIDTVKQGGKYDGLTGVLCSLEVVRYLSDQEIQLLHPIEIVIFAEEEGSNFGVTMIGSKYSAKLIDDTYLKTLHTDKGVTAYDLIKECNFSPERNNEPFIDGVNEKCMVELHVEQGEVLDQEQLEIGIVKAIAGMMTLQITVNGTSNHAGTTPMRLRRDPLLASAKIIDKISEVPSSLGMQTAVATVGKIDVSPNGSNVIASRVIFNVDIRDVIEENISTMTNRIKEIANDIAEKQNVEISIKELGSARVVEMAEHIINTILESTEELGLTYKKMNSGAVHDNAMFSGIIDTGMIFVPSIKGISHSPFEDTKFEDIVSGFHVLLQTVLSLGKSR